jgi:hypothetical protein
LRGKSPQQCSYFTRSAELKQESSLLASLCSLLGVLPRAGSPISRRALANISRGELLCQAFEVYREVVTYGQLKFGVGPVRKSRPLPVSKSWRHLFQEFGPERSPAIPSG